MESQHDFFLLHPISLCILPIYIGLGLVHLDISLGGFHLCNLYKKGCVISCQIIPLRLFCNFFLQYSVAKKIKTFKSKQNCQNPQKRLSSRLSLLTVIQDGIIEIGCAKMSTKFRSADIPNHMWKRPA